MQYQPARQPSAFRLCAREIEAETHAACAEHPHGRSRTRVVWQQLAATHREPAYVIPDRASRLRNSPGDALFRSRFPPEVHCLDMNQVAGVSACIVRSQNSRCSCGLRCASLLRTRVDTIRPGHFRQFLPQELPSSAQSRHHRSQWDSQSFRNLLIRKLLNIREQDDFAEFHGNLLQRIQHVLVSTFLRHNRLGGELDLTIRIVDRHDSRRLHQPSTYVMQTVKHDLKEPCPAVRTHLETMK